jgi:histidyl-tRNA synthetase
MHTTVRGFRDILPPFSELITEIEMASRNIFDLYNYKEIRIPTVEYYQLFLKSTGETTDIVEKEMYKFTDSSKRELAIRPEGTPGVARAYINNNLNLSGKNTKFFYIGNMFRAERPQAGRFREFEQIGLEYINTNSPYSDAEAILVLNHILKKLDINSFSIEINSIGCQECRYKYREKLLNYLNSKKDLLCNSCKTRMDRNPLRTLDCKIDKEILNDIPKIDLCDNCLSHHNVLKNILSKANVNFKENKMLVRGLDYYSRTVFEFKTDLLGSQDAIAAGGRYDNLIKNMGGMNAPAVGWAMGVDRVAMLIEKKEGLKEKKPLVFLVCMNKEIAEYCFMEAQALRDEGISCDFSDFTSSIRSQMRAADNSQAKFAIIIGDDEFKNNFFSLKDLKEKKQIQFKKEELLKYLKENI